MKVSHIILIVVIAASIAVLISMAGDLGTYSDFKDVMKEPAKVHQVVGYLSTGKDIVYDPQKDPNYFSFFMKDKNGIEKKIVYKGAKPQDFERSEQIVLTGQMDKEDFVAKEILLKCPSKYKEKYSAQS
jgi:cytochrome c-type biogenesis protein CcmE